MRMAGSQLSDEALLLLLKGGWALGLNAGVSQDPWGQVRAGAKEADEIFGDLDFSAEDLRSHFPDQVMTPTELAYYRSTEAGAGEVPYGHELARSPRFQPWRRMMGMG